MSTIASAVVAPCIVPLSAQATITTGAPASGVAPVGKDLSGGSLTAIAQTFLTPFGTDHLQSFDFYFTNWINGGSLLLSTSVYEFDTDHLTGPALFHSDLFNGSSNDLGYDVVSFGSATNPLNLFLSQGVTYAFVLSSVNGNTSTPDGSTVQVGTVDDDLYADGSLFLSMETNEAALSQGGGFFASGFPPDAAFDASFTAGAVTVTPEPASLTLFATGAAGLGIFTIRRRRRS